MCHSPAGCTLTATIEKPTGTYNIAVQYFEIWSGISKYELLVNGKTVATWSANDTFAPAQPDPNLDGQDSTRFTAHNIALKPGDTLELRGKPDLHPELAPAAEPASAPNGEVGPCGAHSISVSLRRLITSRLAPAARSHLNSHSRRPFFTAWKAVRRPRSDKRFPHRS